MWQEALKVAAVGFTGVFLALWLLAVSVRVMSLFFRHEDKKAGEVRQ
jgi:Na+-transporting methylmalonyl-CoA/oxaloacetate decarboxylase gamma subunit